ncbi:MAG: hypothetical protein ACI814_003241 [Mariniblastus sp.]
MGNRAGHLAIRNAELNLVRERVLLKEQQRQIMHDLNAAFTEVDRAMANLKTSFNSRVATQDELVPKRKRVDGDVDSVFFLLDAEQRAATAESAVHRAVADYNQALLNYSYASGGLLSRYNIRLTEGEWSESAQANAARKAPRFRRTDNGANQVDVQPVSYGQYDQSAAQPMGGANYNNSPLESNLPSEYDTAPVSDNSVGAVINNKAFDHNGAALIAQDYLRR